MTDASVPGGSITDWVEAGNAELSKLLAERDALRASLSTMEEQWHRAEAEVSRLAAELDACGRHASTLTEEARADERRKIEREIVAPLLEECGYWKTTNNGLGGDAMRQAERWCAEFREQGGNP